MLGKVSQAARDVKCACWSLYSCAGGHKQREGQSGVFAETTKVANEILHMEKMRQ